MSASSNFKIITDSSCDLPAQLIDQLGIISIPLSFSIDEKQYLNYADWREIPQQQFYGMLRDGKLSSTTQINAARYAEVFDSVLKDGQDILYIGFSTGLSGTYNSSVIAANDLAEKYPERTIKCIDSLCGSLGEGLLVHLVASKKLADPDWTLDQACDFIEQTKLKICHEFTVDDLKFLKRGGRISGTAAFIGTMIGIKPVLHMDDNGRLIPLSKVRGRKQSIHALFDKLVANAVNPSEQYIFISHGDCPEDAEYLRGLIQDKFSPKGIIVNCIGPVIGSHSGPGTLALFFIADKR